MDSRMSEVLDSCLKVPSGLPHKHWRDRMLQLLPGAPVDQIGREFLVSFSAFSHAERKQNGAFPSFFHAGNSK